MIKTGTGSSWPLQNWEFVRSMWTDLPPATFYLGAKDLSYTLKIAREIGQSCPLPPFLPTDSRRNNVKGG